VAPQVLQLLSFVFARMTISAASTDFLAAHALHVVLVLSFLTARVWLQTGHSTIFVHGGRAARGLSIESLTRGDLMKCLETGGQTGLSGAPYPSSSILPATYAAPPCFHVFLGALTPCFNFAGV
jgi:hypothetical protein